MTVDQDTSSGPCWQVRERSSIAEMMAAAPPFGAHPAAMSGHAGMAHGGHPMAQGHPSNQGIPGGGQQPGVSIGQQMGQQMHAGVTGPGGPHVSQAGPMMGQMMPGGGPAGVSGNGAPSMHAQLHLTPGHPSQMLAHQQMQQARKFDISSVKAILFNNPE